jgi:peptidoglycan lytic transglycosylase
VKLGLAQLLSIVLLGSALVLVTDGNAETESVLASYYGAELAGQPTATGEPFDPYGYTAAHPTLPLGTELLVSYAGRSVEVTVNDRGPYAGGRGLDLSQGAAEYLGLTRAGVDYVDYAVIGGATADGAGYTTGESYSAEDPWNEQTRGRYVVREGDTLSSIAAELGTTVEQLASSNGIGDPNLIYPGQNLSY